MEWPLVRGQSVLGMLNMMEKRANEIRASVQAAKKLPVSMRLLLAEKTVDQVVVLLCDMCATLDELNARLCECREKILSQYQSEVNENGG